MKPEQDWEELKIGVGPHPIKIKHGWLLIYHGVDKGLVYRAGAALLDLSNPLKVIATTKEPILQPEEDYERIGDVNNVVFPIGASSTRDYMFIMEVQRLINRIRQYLFK